MIMVGGFRMKVSDEIWNAVVVILIVDSCKYYEKFMTLGEMAHMIDLLASSWYNR